MNSRKQQRGFAFVAFTLMLFAVFFFVFVYAFGLFQKQITNDFKVNTQEYINQVGERVEAWYIANADRIEVKRPDLDVTAINYIGEADFVSAADIESELQALFNSNMDVKVDFRVSESQCSVGAFANSPICYKKIIIFSPDPQYGTPTFTLNANPDISDLYIPNIPDGIVATQVSGRNIQLQKLKETLQNMNLMASNLEDFARGKLVSDFDRNVAINYFKAPDCGHLKGDQIACSKGFKVFKDRMDFDRSNLGTTGINFNQMTNAWGLPIAFNNDNDINGANGDKYTTEEYAQDSLPPYSAVFKTQTPWSGLLFKHAVQILN